MKSHEKTSNKYQVIRKLLKALVRLTPAARDQIRLHQAGFLDFSRHDDCIYRNFFDLFSGSNSLRHCLISLHVHVTL